MRIFARAHVALALSALFAGCSGPASQSDDARMALTTVLPLTTQVGNRLLEDFTSPWDPWPNDDLWETVTESRVIVTPENGYLYIETDPDAADPNDFGGRLWVSNWWFEAEPRELFSLEDSHLFLRWVPTYNVNGRVEPSNFTLTDWDEPGDPQIFLIIENSGAGGGDVPELVVRIDDGTTVTSTTVALGGARWFRVRHDATAERVYVDTADDGCDTWTLVLEGPWDAPANAFSLDFLMDTPAANEEPEEAGFSLSRSSSGLLERHEAGETGLGFDANDWTGTANVTGITVNGFGHLVVDVDPAGGAAYRTDLGTLSEVMVYSEVTIQAGESNAWAGVAAHVADEDNLVRAMTVFWVGSAGYVLQEIVGGSAQWTEQPTAAQKTKGTFYRMTLHCDGTDATSFSHGESAGNRTLTHALSSLSSGYPACYVVDAGSDEATTGAFTRWIAMSSRYVTVEGVPNGHFVRIRRGDDGTLVEVEQTGTENDDVILDVIEEVYAGGHSNKPVSVAVYESDGTTLVDDLTPSGGVWGGDTYALAATGGGSAQEITAGFFGPFNPVPQPRTLPLKCTIGAPKVINLTRTLPLSVEIGGS